MLEEFDCDGETVLLFSESFVNIAGLWSMCLKTVGPSLHVLETRYGQVLLHAGRPVAARLNKRNLIDTACLAPHPLSLIKKWAGKDATITTSDFLHRIIVANIEDLYFNEVQP
jgi:hypothetical protein